MMTWFALPLSALLIAQASTPPPASTTREIVVIEPARVSSLGEGTQPSMSSLNSGGAPGSLDAIQHTVAKVE